MSSSASLLFYASAVFAVLGALGTVLSGRPLRSAMALLLAIVSTAGLYLSLHAELLATLQVLVYAGAIVVLFVFVIMIIGSGADIDDEGGAGGISRMLSAVLVVTTGILVLFAIAKTGLEFSEVGETFGSVRAVGQELYIGTAVPFELVSITLLVAILGAIAIARGRSKDEAEQMAERREQHEIESATGGQ